MAGVDHWVVYMQTAVKYSSLYIHHLGALHAPGVVYIESVLFYSSLHIHHQMVYTSHFPIFPSPNPVVVYIFGARIIRIPGSEDRKMKVKTLQYELPRIARVGKIKV